MAYPSAMLEGPALILAGTGADETKVELLLRGKVRVADSSGGGGFFFDLSLG